MITVWQVEDVTAETGTVCGLYGPSMECVQFAICRDKFQYQVSVLSAYSILHGCKIGSHVQNDST